MTKTVFNQSKVDFTKQPMFFGEDGGVQRYDDFRYPQFDKLNQTKCKRTAQKLVEKYL